MSPASRTLALLTAAFLSTACSRDANTDRAVETQTDDGTLVSAMSPDNADSRNSAMVRVVNAVPMSQNLVIRADENRALPSVDYGSVSEYQLIDDTWTTF